MSKQPNYVFDDVDSDELYHHGILGQRWGRRRFQNEDGSWTPEGRERYGEGGAREKSDVQKYKAKVSYNTQKYKADLKAKAQRDKLARAAKEERVKIREQAKSDAIAKREQNKLDRKQAKLDKKLAKEQRKSNDTATLKEKLNRTKKYSMSDDELSNAINRLKLEAEYNKQYVLATQPNSALTKADRFFEGATGKFVRDLAVATIPNVANTVAGKVVDYALKDKGDKVTKELEIAKKKADIKSTLSTARKNNAEAKEKEAKATVAYQTKHQAEVKERAERMFGSNKSKTSGNKVSDSSNKSKTSENKVSDSSNKTVTSNSGQMWKAVPKSVPNPTTPKIDVYLNSLDPTKTHAEQWGYTPSYIEKKKTFKIRKKK